MSETAASHALIVAIVAVTSIAALVAFTRGQARPVRRLGRAVAVALETIGATVLLFALNTAIGAIVVLAGRRLTPIYLSLYDVSDVALLILSLFQALVFQAWRVAARPR